MEQSQCTPYVNHGGGKGGHPHAHHGAMSRRTPTKYRLVRWTGTPKSVGSRRCDLQWYAAAPVKTVVMAATALGSSTFSTITTSARAANT
jgi:hypothetical protein